MNTGDGIPVRFSELCWNIAKFFHFITQKALLDTDLARLVGSPASIQSPKYIRLF